MDAFHYSIYVAIRTSPLRLRRRLAARLATEGDAAAEELTRLVSEALIRAIRDQGKARIGSQLANNRLKIGLRAGKPAAT